jgi:hypothetical protein
MIASDLAEAPQAQRAGTLPADMRRSLAVFDVLVVILLGATAAIAWTGGGRFELLGVPVAARSWPRPLLAALLLFAATHALPAVRGGVADVVRRLAELTTAAMIVGAVGVTAAYIIHACGGLDSHGYVAFSALLSRGHLDRPMPDLSWVPVAPVGDIASPLGFSPSPDGSALVPIFSPGAPLLMAVARLMAGADAVFWVSWICQAALVAVVFLLARHRYGTLTAGLAAALMAAHPVAAAYAMQAMSDVPATLATVLAVYWMCGRSTPQPMLAGLAGSLAVLTRPPLLLALVVLGVLTLRRTPRAALTMGAFVMPGLLWLMWTQYRLFGNPLISGIGSASTLFTLAAVPHNVAAHGKWFLIVHTPLIVPALWLGWRSDRWFATVAASTAAAVALPYAFFGGLFDDWEMVRFLLPGLALLVPIAAEGVATLLRRIPSPAARQWSVVALSLVALLASGRWLDSHGVLTLPALEAKYPRAAEWIASRAPANAVVLASLHSGSVDYYSGRLTLRWDALPADSLAETVTAAGRRGMPVYAVLEGYEMAQFERRFAGQLGSRVDFEPVDRVLTTYIAELRIR